MSWLQSHLNLLVLFGLLGQGMFMMRFVAQWFSSEKAGRSVMPEVFWYFSLAGGVILLIYAILRSDPVFIIGQLTGLFIYIRNIIFIWRDRAKRRSQAHEDVYAEIAALSADLVERQKTGAPITHAERRAAAEALHTLRASRKN